MSVFGDPETLEQRLRAGADPDERDERGRSLMHYSQVFAIPLLVQFGADVNLLRYDWLTAPIRTHSFIWPRMRQLLECGADPEVDTEWAACSEFVRKICMNVIAFEARRDAVFALVLSIDGLSRGMALRVGWWVLRTH